MTSTSGRKASGSRRKEQPPPSLGTKVLAERTRAVAAVGAWVEHGVEGGQDFPEHPSVSSAIYCLTVVERPLLNFNIIFASSPPLQTTFITKQELFIYYLFLHCLG